MTSAEKITEMNFLHSLSAARQRYMKAQDGKEKMPKNSFTLFGKNAVPKPEK